MKSITFIQRFIWIVITILRWTENNFCFNFKMFEYYIIFVKFVFFCCFVCSLCFERWFSIVCTFTAINFHFHIIKMCFFIQISNESRISFWFIQIAFTFTLKLTNRFSCYCWSSTKNLHFQTKKKTNPHNNNEKHRFVFFFGLDCIAEKLAWEKLLFFFMNSFINAKYINNVHHNPFGMQLKWKLAEVMCTHYY